MAKRYPGFVTDDDDILSVFLTTIMAVLRLYGQHFLRTQNIFQQALENLAILLLNTNVSQHIIIYKMHAYILLPFLVVLGSLAM